MRPLSLFSTFHPPKLLVGLTTIFLSNLSMAQQTLFNVSSADITPKNKSFYQHQLNFYSIQKMEFNAHIVYGLGKGWDAGMNLVDLPIWLGQQPFISINDNNSHKPLYPLLMFSVQKQWVLREDKFTLTTGTQIGPNLSFDISKTQIAMMNYSLVRWQFSKRGYVIGGPYHTNDVFVGGHQNNFGLMLGYEYNFKKRWVIMGDFISGGHEKSKTVIGGGYNISERVQLFLGSLLGFPNHSLSNGVILELNWYGWGHIKVH